MNNNEKHWQNPFEKNIVEDWKIEEFPRNYIEMVKCFQSPEFMNILESIDVRPKILMGGRGTGKSHILRMLSIQGIVHKIKIERAQKERKNPQEIKIKLGEYKVPNFGIYLKAIVFSPLSKSNITYLSEDQLKTLFEHFFNMQIAILILDGIKFLTENCEDIPKEMEESTCVKLSEKYHSIKGKTYSEIKKCFENEVDTIRRILRELPWFKDFSRFDGKIHFTPSPDFIIDFFGVINENLLKDKTLLLLLDEYEELDEYQQIFLNFLIRNRRLSFRIASKIGGIKTLTYAPDKELKEIHDYDPVIPLHFETGRENRHLYQNFLENIFISRLNIYGNYSVKNPKIILPSPNLSDEKITDEELQKELKEIYNSLKKEKPLENEYWKTFEGHYKEAAIYRIVRKKGRDKLYAGFDEYVSLSSGIVRQFILLCRDAFSLAHVRGINIEKGDSIPIEVQSEATEKVSRFILEIDTIKSMPSGRGPKIVRLIEDLGRILEAKLYYSTEPQVNRFEIRESQKLARDDYVTLKETIEDGLKLPHFISEIAFRPKQPVYPLSLTFSINNIFAPILKIPPEKRWRFPLTVDDLKDLCSDEKREETLKRIIIQIKGKKRGIKKEIEKEEGQKTLFETSQPINLANCPVTGYGCRDNLTIQMIEEQNLKVFLAVPFERDSWVYDPRKWLKNAMSDNFNIRCVDVDDFPNVGLILCKICSCVRQMPIGLFEITELNPNVIFELGMATGLNKLNFMLVYCNKIPDGLRKEFPPKPFSGIEYVPYELSQNGIIKVIEDKILPTIKELTKHREEQWCWILKGECKHKEIRETSKIFVGVPHDKNPQFFKQVKDILNNLLKNKKVNFFNPAQTLNKLCQLCKEIKESSFHIIDTSYNDYSMLFALGVTFGKDKRFIQLHNTGLSPERPISDLRPWAIEYANTSQLQQKLEEELKKRLEGE